MTNKTFCSSFGDRILFHSNGNSRNILKSNEMYVNWVSKLWTEKDKRIYDWVWFFFFFFIFLPQHFSFSDYCEIHLLLKMITAVIQYISPVNAKGHSKWFRKRNAARVERRTLKGGRGGRSFARDRGRDRFGGSTRAHNAAAATSHGHCAAALSAPFLAGAILVPL